jgi:hypothetical protein
MMHQDTAARNGAQRRDGDASRERAAQRRDDADAPN